MRMGATVRARPDGLVSPPAAPALDVPAASAAEAGRADDDDLEALRPGLVAPPRTGRDAHRVPLLELDDLVVELHPPAPAQDHVHLFLRPVRVAERKAIAGRHALVAQAGSLELERIGRQAELQVRRTVEIGPDVLQVLLEVPQREGHGRDPMAVSSRNGSLARMFDHVGVAVSDLAASERFYRTVLSALGIEPGHADAGLVEWDDWAIGPTDREHPVA